MRSLYHSLLALIVTTGLFLFPLSPTAASEGEFCVQTFNTYGPLYAPHLEKRSRKLATRLDELGHCNVLQLQEVWRGSHKKDLANLLTKPLSKTQLIFSDAAPQGHNSGLASSIRGLARTHSKKEYRASHSSWMDWVRKKLGIYKAYSLTYANFPDKPFLNRVAFYNTHLHHSSAPIRLAQLLELGQEILSQESFSHPVVMTGDYNFPPESLEWRLLTHVFGLKDSYDSQNGPKHDCTYCSENPLSLSSRSRRIDYVFYRSSSKNDLIPLKSKIIFKAHKGQALSDHYGVQTHFYLAERHSLDQSIQSSGKPAPISYETIEKVIELLKQSDQVGFKEHILIAKNLKNRLIQARADDPLLILLAEQKLNQPQGFNFISTSNQSK